MLFFILIMAYVFILVHYYRKYSFKILGDPVFWLLFSTLYYLLLSNYSLFGVNPFELNTDTKVRVDNIIVIVSFSILLSSAFFLKFLKVDYECTFNFEISKLTFQISKVILFFCLLYFLISYAYFFPKAFGLSIPERREVFSELLHLKHWFFNGAFLLASSVAFIKSKSKFKVLFLLSGYAVLLSFPLYVSYRVIAIKSFVFLIVFFSIYIPYHNKSLVQLLLFFSLIILTIVIPLSRIDLGQIELDFFRVMLAPIGEAIFTRQSIDITYENLLSKSDMLTFFQNFLLFSLPSFLRPMEVDNIDKILSNYYFYGKDLGLAGSVLNEGIYYGGTLGLAFSTFAIIFYTFIARFFIYKFNSLMLFFIGLYASANIINLFRNGVSQTMLIYSSSILFSFWIVGRISKHKRN
ncbi:hypothetical protein [Vibrio sp. 2-2(8)]|uniref:hypothetical protein n=1 Tax=Vibrio sp. 2-2(8) TaxID=2591014 RepID=UPI00148331C2|nr:hypothetical protein [Vibrio sp. 2-2(8)]NNN48622.1 hypothetical protein [Vibrio sp. 2-2(8)]